MTEFEALNVRRLLIALDAMRSSTLDWDAALDLAALFGVELQGLFVQDADLLGLAALPIAHEVGRLSGESRPLARDSVEWVLKHRVERTASELMRAAGLRNVAVTHTTARGKLVRQALERGEQGDVVFLAAAGAMRTRTRTPARGRVMLWYDAGSGAEQSIELALHLARRTASALIVGYAAERFPDAAELRARLNVLLRRATGPVELNAFSEARIESILETARSAHITRIVLGAETALAHVEVLEYLCSAFYGDLVLVR
jgi:hypothetical protein